MPAKHTIPSTIRGELGRRTERTVQIGQAFERAVRAELRRRDARALPLAQARRGLLIAADRPAHPLRELPADAGLLWARIEQRAIPWWGGDTRWQRAAA